MKREYHVAKYGSNSNDGSKEFPFLTIQKAADIAEAGDTVVVHEGEYREWVKPKRGGLSDGCRIVYEAAPGEHVVIKGSERIAGWENLEGTVWKVTIPNAFFGDENPFATELNGDWLVQPREPFVHLGDVYLNGKSFYEARSVEEVKNPQVRTISVLETWKGREEQVLEPEQTVYQWFAEVDETNTIIYANFHGADPNQELTEINVRSACFYPVTTNLNYITVRGFEMAQAACPWTPPTSHQIGLLGCHWSKGWIIENNHIHDAKCSGISLGKEVTSGDNEYTRTWKNPGFQNQMEAVFRAKKIGWSKEMIGSHLVRNNIIHDCGQNGIVGHMGSAFSEICGNEIYNISVKREFYGHELGGIKFHAPIDTYIHHNYIHDCSLGMWLDWEIQGTRVSSNIFNNNNRDFMVEVTHGPCMVDNNIFTAAFSLVNAAQGTAFVHNLVAGFMHHYPVLHRSTPYHFPHSTDILGTSLTYGFDDRWYQNIFLAAEREDLPYAMYGTGSYNGAPTSVDEFLEKVKALGVGDVEKYQKIPQPVYIDNNVYYHGAPHFDREENAVCFDKKAQLQICDEADAVYLEFYADKELFTLPTVKVDTDMLTMPRIVQQRFENPDGSDMVIDKDLTNAERKAAPTVGPVENLAEGLNRVRIWSRV